jgi:hypothetical protein
MARETVMHLRGLFANPPALLGLCVATALTLVVARVHARAPEERPAPVLRQFATTIDRQFHECVPLGWFPDTRPWRGYFPVYNTNVADKGAWIQAIWVGVVPSRMLGDSHVAADKAVMDALSDAGLLVRHDSGSEFRYTLTHDGEQYYYERNHLGNNGEGWSYLCFNRLRVKDVTWAPRATNGKYAGDVTARVRFTWETTPDAAWVTPFLKAHAVELNPTSSPAEATAHRYRDGEWALSELDFTFPLVEHPSAWTAAL